MDIYSQQSVGIIKNGIILDQKDITTLEDTNMDTRYNCSPYYSCKGFSLLHKLVLLTNKYPKLNIVIKEYIASYPEELNKVNEYGWSALHLASRNSNTWSNIKTVKLILSCVKNNADINAKTKYGNTALMFASENSNDSSSLETVNLLLKNNADINAKNINGTTALMLASENSNDGSSLETVNLLLKNNADVNAKTKHGHTALMHVKPSSNITAKLLLEYDANVLRIPNKKFPEFENNIKLLNVLS